jgi:hypothetical protein
MTDSSVFSSNVCSGVKTRIMWYVCALVGPALQRDPNLE